MAPLSFPQLGTESRGFLSPPHLMRIGQGVILRSQFDMDAFTPQLFDALGIDRPASLAAAIEKRQAEFLAGRTMARLAQEALGHRPAPIPIGQNRAPIWPPALHGSITHARGYCGCFAQPGEYGYVGIDVDRITKDHALEAILRLVVSDTERSVLDTATMPLNLAATLVFSAKETLFKALYPIVQRHFGFSSAALMRAPDHGTLRLCLTETLHPSLPEGLSFDISYDQVDQHISTWLIHRP